MWLCARVDYLNFLLFPPHPLYINVHAMAVFSVPCGILFKAPSQITVLNINSLLSSGRVPVSFLSEALKCTVICKTHHRIKEQEVLIWVLPLPGSLVQAACERRELT